MTGATQLHLVSGGLDRAAERRTDADWLQAAMADASAQIMWVSQGAVAVDPALDHANGLQLWLASASGLMDAVADVSFLGLRGQGSAHFAVHCAEQSQTLAAEPVRWMSLRELGLHLPADQAAMAVTAVALDNWRRRTRRCPSCGGALVPVQAGWALRCPDDGSEHFPRTDPAVIVLVRDAADRALLGRQVAWEPGWMSTLAGFVEAGESAEAAVRREVFEETGVRIGPSPGHLEYLGSQPWPFPASLMLGYHAWLDQDDVAAAAITVDETEIAEARWFSRAELDAACAAREVRLPPRLSISRFLIERWYGSPLPGDWLRG